MWLVPLDTHIPMRVPDLGKGDHIRPSSLGTNA